MLIFAIGAFWLISGVLTFTKFVKFLKSTVRGGRYLFSSPKLCLICFNLNEPYTIYTHKHNAYKKVYLYSSQTQILVLNYISLLFAISRNANLFVHGKLTKLLPRANKCTFRKENSGKNKKFKERTFAMVCWNFAE